MKEFYIQVLNSVVYVKLCQLANTQWAEIVRGGKIFKILVFKFINCLCKSLKKIKHSQWGGEVRVGKKNSNSC
jgi:hypothetical protein